MKQLLSKPGIAFIALAIFGLSLTSCKSKPKDADVQAAIETAFKANPSFAGAAVTVADGVATISGQVKDDATKAALETAAKAIAGVKSVTNALTIAPPPPPPAPVTVSADETLTKNLTDAVKDFGSVKTDVKDGVVTLTGEIKRTDLPKLLQHINALKPKKVVNQLTIK